MLACVFLEESWKPSRKRANTARTLRCCDVDVSSILEGTCGNLRTDTVKVEGVLYLWLGHADRNGGQAQLTWSRDHGATWKIADWRFAEFGLVGFINFGKDYAEARDEFVYAYSHDGPQADGPADRFVLMRVPQDRITNRAAWEFFVRRDDQPLPEMLFSGDGVI